MTRDLDLGIKLEQGAIMATKSERRARVLRAAEIFRKNGITQDEIASVVGASQPQISRVLQGNGLRATKLSEEICLYAERLEGGGLTAEAVRANEDLIEALRVTWDGSAGHAKALSTVIRSLVVLRK